MNVNQNISDIIIIIIIILLLLLLLLSQTSCTLVNEG